ncbi:unnamed protein product [Calypogeia fissa]
MDRGDSRNGRWSSGAIWTMRQNEEKGGTRNRGEDDLYSGGRCTRRRREMAVIRYSGGEAEQDGMQGRWCMFVGDEARMDFGQTIEKSELGGSGFGDWMAMEFEMEERIDGRGSYSERGPTSCRSSGERSLGAIEGDGV